MNLQRCTIAIIGLGYVGLPLAVEFSKKRSVIGYDINEKRIKDLQAYNDQTLEISEKELRNAKELSFTSDISDIKKATVYIVTVPTPVDSVNRPDLMPLIKASETVGKVLKNGDIVIFESTVYPGATEEVCVPVLERESGLKYISSSSLEESNIYKKGFYCGYSPERINPGDKTHRLVDIKKIVGGSTPEVTAHIDLLYKEIIRAGTHKVSSIKVAEAAKVIENTQRDLNIAFVNELSLIFNCMEIDTSEVLEAAGTKWNFLNFKPGLVGGHCIGVDPYYLTHKAQELGYQPQVILSGRRINDEMGRYVARRVLQMMVKNGIIVSNSTIGILGITFKENCPDVRNSKVIDIVDELKNWGANIKIADPWANVKEVKKEYGLELEEISINNQVDILIVAVGHNEYKSMKPIELMNMCTKKQQSIIADVKSLFSRKKLEEEGFIVFRL